MPACESSHVVTTDDHVNKTGFITDKLYNYASIIDDSTIAQAERISRMPFIYQYVTLMPDAHIGTNATVGSVIPTLNAIIPATIGVDIGYGMIAIRTQFKTTDVDMRMKSLDKLRMSIQEAIPLGNGDYNHTIESSARSRINDLLMKAQNGYKNAGLEADGFDPVKYDRNWKKELGTLGAGNHFIEISHDENDYIWLLLHSGSCGIGNKLAKWHISIAQGLMDKYWIPLPDNDDSLAYLVANTPEFNQYMF